MTQEKRADEEAMAAKIAELEVLLDAYRTQQDEWQSIAIRATDFAEAAIGIVLRCSEA